MKETKALRALTNDQLRDELRDAELALMKLRATGLADQRANLGLPGEEKKKSGKPIKVRRVRKRIARILTILRQRRYPTEFTFSNSPHSKGYKWKPRK